MSYTIDVFRGKAKVQKNLLKLATYVSLFPQLIAGPIVRYKDIQERIDNRVINCDTFAYGVKRFVIGISKKVLIANALGELSVLISNSNTPSVILMWMGGIAFSLQIYFDFSGYSDMAIGLGRMFGFKFLENFNYPYILKSITEFWRRWHISLGSWFKNYYLDNSIYQSFDYSLLESILKKDINNEMLQNTIVTIHEDFTNKYKKSGVYDISELGSIDSYNMVL